VIKQRRPSLKTEYRAALAYYKGTVWKYARTARLHGAQFDIAYIAYNRLLNARHHWLESLDPAQRAEAHAAEPNLENKSQPRRRERDDTIKPEHLAAIASMRLGAKKKKSTHEAVKEAHEILLTARDYLDGLPKPKSDGDLAVEAHLGNSVSFDEIVSIGNSPGSLPLLHTVQLKRNGGELTLRALEQAIRRHGSRTSNKDSGKEIIEALKSRVISCKVLEEIRWDRFRRHYKP
jgi:hypothetical protein